MTVTMNLLLVGGPSEYRGTNSSYICGVNSPLHGRRWHTMRCSSILVHDDIVLLLCSLSRSSNTYSVSLKSRMGCEILDCAARGIRIRCCRSEGCEIFGIRLQWRFVIAYFSAVCFFLRIALSFFGCLPLTWLQTES